MVENMKHELLTEEWSVSPSTLRVETALTESGQVALDNPETERLLVRLKKAAKRRFIGRTVMKITVAMSLANSVAIYLVVSAIQRHWATIGIDFSRAGLLEGHDWPAGYELNLGAGWFIISALLAIAYGVARYAVQSQTRATRDLLPLDDKRMVGPLAQALELGDPLLHAMAEERLEKQLQNLHAADSDLLDGDQRGCLRRAAEASSDHLTLAILKLWQKIGEKEDLTVAERLASGRSPLRVRSNFRGPIIGLIVHRDPRRPDSDRIRAAANEAVAAIRARMELSKRTDLLLRPAEREEHEDTLLRPVADTESADPAVLLRPSSSS